MNYRWISDWFSGVFKPQPQIELASEDPVKMVIFHLKEGRSLKVEDIIIKPDLPVHEMMYYSFSLTLGEDRSKCDVAYYHDVRTETTMLEFYTAYYKAWNARKAAFTRPLRSNLPVEQEAEKVASVAAETMAWYGLPRNLPDWIGPEEHVYCHVDWWAGFVEDIIHELDQMYDYDTFANRYLTRDDIYNTALGFLSTWATRHNWRVLPHVKESLITLKDMGIQPIIIADDERRMSVLLRKLGITSLLSQPPVLTSSLKMRVEDPKAIIKIAKMCYLQPGEQILVVGKTFAQHQGTIKAGVRSITITGPCEVPPRYTGYRWEPHFSSVQWVHSLPDLIQEIKRINRPRLWKAKKRIYYRVIDSETAIKVATAFPKEDDSASPSSPTDTTDTTDSANTPESTDTSPPPQSLRRSAPNSLDKEKMRSSLDSFAMAESAANSIPANSFGGRVLFPACM
ncbi:hypothetical protein EHS25_003595 [Saitozyma podzolica]|uniref:Uncharacterized protein n=1 Tax=Saitozyma podzolica TaxID=1890683 RepID=A0A427Y7Q7_9TREE|nr:hypothetical protein EHS25_003595 [Saitozyma podzolica]